MNSKACRELRKAIEEQYPNLNKSMKKKIFKEGKKQFEILSPKEKGQDIIEIK
jgi:hypothetical protein